MATTFLDLIVMLLWPLALSAATWAIAINALADSDEISDVVEALTPRNDVEENAKREELSLRRNDLSPIPRGYGGRFRAHFRVTRHTTVMQGTLLHEDNRRRGCATVARLLREHELSEDASP